MFFIQTIRYIFQSKFNIFHETTNHFGRPVSSQCAVSLEFQDTQTNVLELLPRHVGIPDCSQRAADQDCFRLSKRCPFWSSLELQSSSMKLGWLVFWSRRSTIWVFCSRPVTFLWWGFGALGFWSARAWALLGFITVMFVVWFCRWDMYYDGLFRLLLLRRRVLDEAVVLALQRFPPAPLWTKVVIIPKLPVETWLLLPVPLPAPPRMDAPPIIVY